jgi:3-hydroxyacyl-[acyl-carrier-protein] dehydratase
MRPFLARWQLGPLVAGRCEARLVLDDARWFAGHFPGLPVLPGSFLIEAVVQAATAALGQEARLAEVTACRFHALLFPGDEIVARLALAAAGGDGTRVEATVHNRGQLAAEVTLLVTAAAARAVPATALPAAGGHVLDAAFIARVLPHHPPALSVDCAQMVDAPGKRPVLRAHKTVRDDEPCYADAEGVTSRGYPDFLVIESFCQACGLLRVTGASSQQPANDERMPTVAKLVGLRLFGSAGPGDLLEHNVELVVRTDEGAVFRGQTVVGGRLILDVGRAVAIMAKMTRS